MLAVGVPDGRNFGWASTSSHYQESVGLCVLYDIVVLGVLYVVFTSCLMCLIGGLMYISEWINHIPEAAATDLWETANSHYSTFWDLREHFRIEGESLFQVTQKAHSNMHSCLRAGELNPRVCWCFKYEDYMGILRKLASSTKHSYGVETSKNMLRKWLVAIDWLLRYSYIMR